MTWDIQFTAKAKKQFAKLPRDVRDEFVYLVREIKHQGPTRANWPHYGKVRAKKDCHHCHLKKGKSTFVAVWQVTDKTTNLVEVKYVGTHEGADYQRLC